MNIENRLGPAIPAGGQARRPWPSRSPLGVAGAADFGHHYWTAGRYLESTDDAYVKADSTIIAPKVSGYIAEVLVGDNQPVKAGQVLARIDDRDFRAALDQAQGRRRGRRGRGRATSTRRSPCSSR